MRQQPLFSRSSRVANVRGGVVRRDAGRLHPGRACSPDSALKAQLLASPATTGAWRGNTRSESTRSRPSAYFIDGIDALSYCRLAIRHAKGSPDRQCGRGRAGPAIVVVGSAPLRWDGRALALFGYPPDRAVFRFAFTRVHDAGTPVAYHHHPLCSASLGSVRVDHAAPARRRPSGISHRLELRHQLHRSQTYARGDFYRT